VGVAVITNDPGRHRCGAEVGRDRRRPHGCRPRGVDGGVPGAGKCAPVAVEVLIAAVTEAGMVTSYSRLDTVKLRRARASPGSIPGCGRELDESEPGTDGHESGKLAESAPATPGPWTDVTTPAATAPTSVPESTARLARTREDFRVTPTPMRHLRRGLGPPGQCAQPPDQFRVFAWPSPRNHQNWRDRPVTTG